MPSVLWAYRTTERVGMRETTYNMVYGSKAVLLAEIVQESARISNYGPENNMLHAMDLDLLEETKGRAVVRLESYRMRMARSYNKRVRPQSLELGDLVMNII